MSKTLECPRCGGEMALRKNAANGNEFYGCKRYPDCRGTRSADGESSEERRTSDALPSERVKANDRERWRRE